MSLPIDVATCAPSANSTHRPIYSATRSLSNLGNASQNSGSSPMSCGWRIGFSSELPRNANTSAYSSSLSLFISASCCYGKACPFYSIETGVSGLLKPRATCVEASPCKDSLSEFEGECIRCLYKREGGSLDTCQIGARQLAESRPLATRSPRHRPNRPYSQCYLQTSSFEQSPRR